MSHETHLSDTVGTLRPDICDDCRESVAGAKPTRTSAAQANVELAQAKLNRAVSRWAHQWSGFDASTAAMDLHTAFTQYQETVQRSFMATVNTQPEPEMPPAPRITWNQPTYDPTAEARIANLLAVVNYPASISGGDLVRKAALARALAMLGLDQVAPS